METVKSWFLVAKPQMVNLLSYHEAFDIFYSSYVMVSELLG